jgi:hypothetical protein
MTAATRWTLDWASLVTGFVVFWVLVVTHRWATAAAIGLIVALHLRILVTRPGPP